MYRDPSVVDRSIVVVAMLGAVAGIDRATGAEVWRNSLPGGGGGEVELAIAWGRVFVTSGGAQVACLDYRGGQTLWTAPTRVGGRGTILVEDDQVIVAKSGYVDCFDFEGRPLWSQELKGMGAGRAALGVPGHVRQADDAGG